MPALAQMSVHGSSLCTITMLLFPCWASQFGKIRLAPAPSALRPLRAQPDMQLAPCMGLHSPVCATPKAESG
ncbi:MAG TPA: hypothetical protein DEO49_05235 [Sutterella sp.]|nr:hypothetical protein [Sutterella sp.]